jgi:hypothetical protein
MQRRLMARTHTVELPDGFWRVATPDDMRELLPGDTVRVMPASRSMPSRKGKALEISEDRGHYRVTIQVNRSKRHNDMVNKRKYVVDTNAYYLLSARTLLNEGWASGNILIKRELAAA